MASYRVELKASALKVLDKLPHEVIPRIVAALAELKESPLPHGVKKLSGIEHTYRLRIGDYRVV
jgi:mRNA interferase RelE/StbE